ncbi:MAG: AI-2E family transporter [Bryobacterales bacterium]|nr:AI-2E family transporter [Bryobacterales bacterium]
MVAILYFARQMLIPFAVALVLTFLLSPLVMALQKCRFRRIPAVVLVVAIAGAAAGALAWYVVGQVIVVLTELPKYQQNIHNKIQSLRSPAKGPISSITTTVRGINRELSLPDATNDLPTASGQKESANTTKGVRQVQIVSPPANAWKYLEDVGSPLLAPVADGAVVLIFTLFMLVKKEDLRNRLLRLAGVRQLNVMTLALDDAARRVSRYLLMQALVNATFGVLFGTGLYFIGLPNAALWGLIAGVLRVIPYVGTLLAAVLPLTLSLAVFNSWLPPFLVLLLYAVLELGIANIVEPWLYGAHTGISPFAILVATVFWGMLWGPAGLIVSTPLTVCLIVLGRYVPQMSFLHVLLGDEPVLAPQAQLYQRLIAMDQVEAREIAELFLKEGSLVELYDSVFIPALSLAEQDRHKGALDQDREEFFFLNVGEMIAELSEREEQNAAEAGTRTTAEATAELDVAKSFSDRIICFPANDEADQVAAVMLAQILERVGYQSFPFRAADWCEAYSVPSPAQTISFLFAQCLLLLLPIP